VQPLLAAAAAGEYGLADLRVACGILANDPNAPGAAAKAATEGEVHVYLLLVQAASNESCMPVGSCVVVPSF
jgi:hypothetical protein